MSLAWTKEPPTKPGWYWLRLHGEDDQMMTNVWVSEVTGSLLVGEGNTPVSAIKNAVWAGPLEPPS